MCFLDRWLLLSFVYMRTDVMSVYGIVMHFLIGFVCLTSLALSPRHLLRPATAPPPPPPPLTLLKLDLKAGIMWSLTKSSDEQGAIALKNNAAASLIVDWKPRAMDKALAEVMPESRHCLSTWHLLQNGIKHLGNLMKGESDFLRDFKRCICKKFETSGILCSHALKVFEANDVKDKELKSHQPGGVSCLAPPSYEPSPAQEDQLSFTECLMAPHDDMDTPTLDEMSSIPDLHSKN
ncbi:hypothetical protein RIF29_22412 [Crotalaria pallida]|uniref:Protein FAR1-RELATED SEQUENCE n=1 Tax=Crotalaria pallida TaxID=3830 RepID=A0AAN9I6U7_CROPI